MAFSESEKSEVYTRSGGQCECYRQHLEQNAPHHGGVDAQLHSVVVVDNGMRITSLLLAQTHYQTVKCYA